MPGIEDLRLLTDPEDWTPMPDIGAEFVAYEYKVGDRVVIRYPGDIYDNRNGTITNIHPISGHRMAYGVQIDNGIQLTYTSDHFRPLLG